MRETIEFRIPEEFARDYLRPTVGVCLGGNVRKVLLPISDPLVARFVELQEEFRSHDELFFYSSAIHRHYTNRELEIAEAFRPFIKHTFEPAGEQCGTLYDDSAACTFCGANARRVGDLILNSQSLPARGNLAIASSIAGEVVVSRELVEIFQANRLRGAEFRRVKQHKDPSLSLPKWCELIVVSPRLSIVPPTRAGIMPFDEGSERFPDPATAPEEVDPDQSWCDKHNSYQCPLGHTIGLNLLSELTVQKEGFKGYDIACTKQLVGARRGLLRPEPLFVVSPRLRELILKAGLKGMNFEVAHLEE